MIKTAEDLAKIITSSAYRRTLEESVINHFMIDTTSYRTTNLEDKRKIIENCERLLKASYWTDASEWDNLAFPYLGKSLTPKKNQGPSISGKRSITDLFKRRARRTSQEEDNLTRLDEPTATLGYYIVDYSAVEEFFARGMSTRFSIKLTDIREAQKRPDMVDI